MATVPGSLKTFGLASLGMVHGFCIAHGCTPFGTALDVADGGTSDAKSSQGTDAAPSADATPGANTSPMTFFVTSIGSGGRGGDLGGLTGADAKCAALATAVGAGAHTWRAYLSAEANGTAPAVNARDRIGAGPWTNQSGKVVASDLTQLHTIGISPADILDEKGQPVPAAEHDILTGSNADGTLFATATATCKAYTTSTGDGVYCGHSDGAGGKGGTWNSAQSVGGCDEGSLVAAKGSGRIYCFARD